MRAFFGRRSIVLTASVAGVVVFGVLAFAGSSSQKSKTPRPPTVKPAALATVGPGPVMTVRRAGRYELSVRVTPNHASSSSVISVKLLKGGRPVSGARVKLTFSMLDMEGMGQLTGLLPQRSAGQYRRTGPVLGMSGRWALKFDVAPPGTTPFKVDLIDWIYP